ncbi:hypothetical protein DFR70_111209 [Nocardia tenerifensis]|uniref:Type III secretion system (T3SS) negative regulator GrlR n=1 Tax=Nocardia tenerifensis TaxID=228006 RepID=A0A318JV65_9NOCA|nr:hypothetical protein [Nocardia tenerifensis]PXX59824.1 hypothetical protein DFR70_111209 [Nocardia tenerifensis]
MTDKTPAAADDRIVMNGSATLLTVTDTAGIGAVTGTVTGAAYGEPTSELVKLDDGSLTYTMFHEFLDHDGSRLYTNDRAFLRPGADGESSTLEVEYTVAEATGRFAGYSGTFRSRGWLKTPPGDEALAQHSVGAVQFEGEIHRSDRP